MCKGRGPRFACAGRVPGEVFSDECRGDGGESDQIDKWCSVVTTGTKPTPTKEQPITDRHTDLIRTR